MLSYQYKKGDNNLVEIILINKVHYDNYQSQEHPLSLLKSDRQWQKVSFLINKERPMHHSSSAKKTSDPIPIQDYGQRLLR